MDDQERISSLARIASISFDAAKETLTKNEWDLKKSLASLSRPPDKAATTKTPNQMMFSLFRQFLDEAESKNRETK